MASKGKRISVFTITLLVFFIFLFFSFPRTSVAGDKVAEEVLFSLDAQNEPLGNVLEKIEQLTCYKILIDAQFKNIPVRASLKEVSLREGVMRILNKHNTVVRVDNVAKTCEVIIFEGSRSLTNIPPISEDKVLAAKGKAYSPDQVVIPPSMKGGHGITVRELEAILARHSAEGNNKDLVAIPPTEPGKKGITRREIETRIKLHSSTEPETFAPVPPSLRRTIEGR